MSTRSVADKLLIKPDSTVWAAPPTHLHLVGPLPDGARPVDDPAGATVGLVFAEDAAALRGILDAHRTELARPGTLWVAYPKGNRSDINRDSLWPILVEYGMRPIGQVAIDDVWSALRFRPQREGEAPFTGGR